MRSLFQKLLIVAVVSVTILAIFVTLVKELRKVEQIQNITDFGQNETQMLGFLKQVEKSDWAYQDISNQEAIDYNFTKPLEFTIMELKPAIEEILGKNSNRYGVHISLPKLNISLDFNGDKQIYPASISKLPIALLILRDIDSGKFSLDQKVAIRSSDKAHSSDRLYYRTSGSRLPIREYLRLLIVESDNTAMKLLERLLGGARNINTRALAELQISNLSRLPMSATANQVGKLWQGIYNQSYLSKNANDLLLNFLSNTASWLQDRIPAGTPTGTRVAHKIGSVKTKFGLTYVDSGIVFGSKNDFIIVVLNQDVTQMDAIDKIKKITRLVYSAIH